MAESIDNILVVKVGTSTLVRRHSSGLEQLDASSFNRLGEQVTKLQDSGYNVVLVSSAAITAGIWETGVKERPDKETEMSELQRLASIGWRHVLNEWGGALRGRTIGELLLTKHELDTVSEERDEALRTTYTLLRHGNIPIVNENDAITHDEIAFGDNDTLAATFAAQLGRSALFGNNIHLVLLTDVEGVYEKEDSPASVVRVINNISEYEHLAQPSRSISAAGGMITKFDAAKIAAEAGVNLWIANGRTDNAIERAIAGEIGTHFIAPRASA